MEQKCTQDGSNNQQQNPMPLHWQGFTFMNESEDGLLSGHSELSLRQTPTPVESQDRPHLDLQSLATTQVGDRVRIVSLNCGGSNNRLMGMGFLPNVLLEVVSCTKTGSVVVALPDQRLGLGAELASRIQVIKADPSFQVNQLKFNETVLSPDKRWPE